MTSLSKDKENFAILLVDDNDNNLFTLSSRLKKEGYLNIQTAANGTEALSKIANGCFDLVLLDLMMPDIDGKDVLKKIKSNQKTEQIMVMMISGDTRIESSIDCIKLGAEDFLQKLFNADLLRARIGSCLKKKLYYENAKIFEKKISQERLQYKQLLDATFPQKIISELAKHKKVKPCLYKNVAVIFVDIYDFTSYCSKNSPEEIFKNIQLYVNLCEKIALAHNLEKIKTIGDAFMASSGMFIQTENPVSDVVKFALELLEKKDQLDVKWDLHIGIDYGEVMAGVIGHSKYLFDIWGDVVNSASRIQTIGEKNIIRLSKDAFTMVSNECEGKSIGDFSIKGKGDCEIFEVYSYGSRGI